VGGRKPVDFDHEGPFLIEDFFKPVLLKVPFVWNGQKVMVHYP
jgi:hypothetical protein